MTEAAAEQPVEKAAGKAPSERTKAINKAYGAATKRLKETHLDEFRTFQKEALAEVGITDWEPTPTPEEKARAEVAAILRENESVKTELFSEIEAKVRAELGVEAPAQPEQPQG